MSFTTPRASRPAGSGTTAVSGALMPAIEGYLDELRRGRRLSPRTVDSYGFDLADYARFATRHQLRGWHEATSTFVDGYFATLERKERSTATLARRRSALRGFHAFLGRVDHTASDPVAQLPPPRRERKLPHALALADVEALPWGVVKGLYLRVLRNWSTLPIAERDGVLGVGYGYVNPRVGETYVSSCSPYWAMKAFLPLALPDDHPFWAAEERPVPSPTGPAVQRHAAMVVTGDAEQALAVCAGQPAPAFVSDGRAKYARLAYTSLGGPCLELGRDVDGRVVDATVSVVRNEERAVRESPTDAHVSRDAVTSRWEPWPGVAVETTVRGAAPWHARVHVVETSDPLLVEDWGFSLGYEREREEVTGFESDVALGRAVATSPYGCSGIVDPAGAAAAHLRRTPPNADVVHPRAVVPVLVTRLDPGRHRLPSRVYRSGPAGASAWSDPPATLLAWVEPAGAVPRTAPSFSSRALADSWRRRWRKGVRGR